MSDPINDQELKALINFFIVLGGDIEKLVAKGSLSLLDLPGLYGAFSAAGPALSGLKQLPSEVASLNDASLTDLQAYITSQIANVVPNPAIDALIEEGLALGQQLFDFINALKVVKSPSPSAAVPAPK